MNNELPVRLTVELSLHEYDGAEIPISIGIYKSDSDVSVSTADLSDMDMHAIMHGLYCFADMLRQQHECNSDIDDQLSQLGFKLPEDQ